jgi:uncharacterized protein YceK
MKKELLAIVAIVILSGCATSEIQDNTSKTVNTTEVGEDDPFWDEDDVGGW